jgi:conjugal transfer pilus assembly protein TraV
MKNLMIVLVPLLLLLSSCAKLNSQFDCPMKSGIRCESLSSINARVDRGELGIGKQDINEDSVAMPTYIPQHNTNGHLTSKRKPLRYAETVQRVWIAPFEDKQGNYHQENTIYTVAKSGRWQGTPLKEIDLPGE